MLPNAPDTRLGDRVVALLRAKMDPRTLTADERQLCARLWNAIACVTRTKSGPQHRHRAADADARAITQPGIPLFQDPYTRICPRGHVMRYVNAAQGRYNVCTGCRPRSWKGKVHIVNLTWCLVRDIDPDCFRPRLTTVISPRYRVCCEASRKGSGEFLAGGRLTLVCVAREDPDPVATVLRAFKVAGAPVQHLRDVARTFLASLPNRLAQTLQALDRDDDKDRQRPQQLHGSGANPTPDSLPFCRSTFEPTSHTALLSMSTTPTQTESLACAHSCAPVAAGLEQTTASASLMEKLGDL
jgi:hypothetical protein